MYMYGPPGELRDKFMRMNKFHSKRQRRIIHDWYAYAFVPINEQGIYDLEYGPDDENENLLCYKLPYCEVHYLWHFGIFDYINDKYDLLIDEGEEETISADQLERICFEICRGRRVWSEAVNKAIECGTYIYLVL